jgi:beta-lactamase class A
MEAAMTEASLRRRGTAAALAVATATVAWLAAAGTAADPPAVPPAHHAALTQGTGATATGEQRLLERLRERIDLEDARLDGVLGVYVEDLATGTRIELRPDQPFPTASTIKLAVLYELYRQTAEGRVDPQTLVAPPPNPVPSAGILRFMSPRSQLTLRDLGLLVMSLSDNEAANELIRRVGMENVNRRLDELSLPATRLRRLMLDLDAARQGRENVSTPREMAALAGVVGRGRELPPALAADLLTVATVPDPGSFVRRALPEERRAVSKAGTLEGVRCEVAWVDVPGRPYTAAVMTSYLGRDQDGEAAITAIAAVADETFSRLARSSPYGRVSSNR